MGNSSCVTIQLLPKVKQETIMLAAVEQLQCSTVQKIGLQ